MSTDEIKKKINAENALNRYYTKRYGADAEMMKQKNQLKKGKDVSPIHAGRPPTQTKEEYKKKQYLCSLKNYYVKRYGAEQAPMLMALNQMKKNLGAKKF
jgi:hypothetical protein